MDAQLKRGLLEAAVLSALREGDSYGYRIIRSLTPYVEISESTLYPILKRLESGGALHTYRQEHSGRLRKYYHLTTVGEARLQEFVASWPQVRRIYAFIVHGDQGQGDTYAVT